MELNTTDGVVPDMLNYERTTRVGLITGLCGEKSRSGKAFKLEEDQD